MAPAEETQSEGKTTQFVSFVNDADLLPLFTILLPTFEMVGLPSESPKRHLVSDHSQGVRAINASNRSGLGGFN